MFKRRQVTVKTSKTLWLTTVPGAPEGNTKLQPTQLTRMKVGRGGGGKDGGREMSFFPNPAFHGKKKRETRCRGSTAMVTEQQIYFLNHKYVSISYQITERSKDSHLQAKISIKKTFNVLSGLWEVLFQLFYDSCPHRNGKIAARSWFRSK